MLQCYAVSFGGDSWHLWEFLDFQPFPNFSFFPGASKFNNRRINGKPNQEIKNLIQPWTHPEKSQLLLYSTRGASLGSSIALKHAVSFGRRL